MNCEEIETATIEAYRIAYKEYENICTVFSKSCGISDAEYWIMIMIREGVITQKDISERYFISKQTVNSACMQLLKRGFIRLESPGNNLRTKHLFLTEAGNRFAEKYIDVIDSAEERAWNALSENEKSAFLSLTKKYNNLMKAELENIKSE